jgi:hypothetical protein
MLDRSQGPLIGGWKTWRKRADPTVIARSSAPHFGIGYRSDGCQYMSSDTDCPTAVDGRLEISSADGHHIH